MIFSLVFYISIPLVLFLIDLSAQLLPPNKRKTDVLLVFDCLVFLLVFSVRSPAVGTDTIAYYTFFRNCKIFTFESVLYRQTGFELGFSMYTWLFSRSNLPFWAYLFCSGCIVLCPLAFFFKKYSKIPTLSFILFACFGLFSFVMSGLRQAMAIGFLLLGLSFFDPKKKISFLFYSVALLIAFFFHSSALIGLILPFFFFSPSITKKAIVAKYLSLIVVAFAAPFLYSEFFFFNQAMTNGLVSASSPAPMTLSYPETGIIYLSAILGVDILLLFPNVSEKLNILASRKNNTKKTLILFQANDSSVFDVNFLSSMVFTQIIFLCFARSTTTFTRLGFYFSVGFYALLPDAINRFFVPKIQNILYVALVIFSMLFFVFAQLRNNAGGILPFQIGI